MLERSTPAAVARHRCPTCRGPLRPPQPGGPPYCPRCGGSLAARGRHRLQAGVLLAAAAALLVAALPDLLQGTASLAVRTSWLALPALERFEPPPDPALQPLALLKGDLLERLSEGDRRWEPSVEYLPDGSARYHYRRRAGEPPLSLAALRHRLEFPASYSEERRAVIRLLHSLQAAGVQLELSQPRKPGAAAEWDAAHRTLRIDPKVPDKGSLDFARVLNHEAIHVAQSCRAGGLRASPAPLGLDRTLSPSLAQELEGPTYARASALERSLEAEAYANQERLAVGEALVRRHCRLRG